MHNMGHDDHVLYFVLGSVGRLVSVCVGAVVGVVIVWFLVFLLV